MKRALRAFGSIFIIAFLAFPILSFVFVSADSSVKVSGIQVLIFYALLATAIALQKLSK